MATWKNTERKLAKMLGGIRVPITGRQRGDAPDIMHHFLSIEVKHRKKLPEWLHDAMAQAIACMRSNVVDLSGESGPDKIPIVILHQTGMKHDNDYVILRMKDFVEAINEDDAEENNTCN